MSTFNLDDVTTFLKSEKSFNCGISDRPTVKAF